ncbi:MAG: hypothetical protein Q9198_002649 [Flavoplaca austrocitrina]
MTPLATHLLSPRRIVLISPARRMPTASNVNNQIEAGAVLSQNFKTEVTVSKPKKSKWKSTTMIAVTPIVTVHGSLDEISYFTRGGLKIVLATAEVRSKSSQFLIHGHTYKSVTTLEMSVMESVIPSTEAMTTHEAVWNEARVESSMAQLQEMHARLCNLRDTVSRLVDPMLIQQSSPEELYHGFSSNVTRTQTDVQKFAELARSDRSKEIFKRAAESRAQNSEDIRGWRVTEHEDWLDIPGADVPKDVRANEMSTMESNSPPRTSVEDLSAALEHFKSSHPGADGSFDENSKAIMVLLVGHPRGSHAD